MAAARWRTLREARFRVSTAIPARALRSATQDALPQVPTSTDRTTVGAVCSPANRSIATPADTSIARTTDNSAYLAVCDKAWCATRSRAEVTTVEPVWVAVVVPPGNTMTHPILSKAGVSVAARIPHRAEAHMEGSATRRTVYPIFWATLGRVASTMVARILVHTSLLLFIAAPVHACPHTAGNANPGVVAGVARPI